VRVGGGGGRGGRRRRAVEHGRARPAAHGAGDCGGASQRRCVDRHFINATPSPPPPTSPCAAMPASKASYALLTAAAKGDLPGMAAALAAGAKMEAFQRTRSGTPLVCAVREGHTAAVASLLAAGASPNACDHEGHTALIFATAHTAALVAALAGAGADLAQRDDRGWTAMHHAANWASADTVSALLAAGASPSAPTSTGQTPLQLVRRVSTPLLCVPTVATLHRVPVRRSVCRLARCRVDVCSGRSRQGGGWRCGLCVPPPRGASRRRSPASHNRTAHRLAAPGADERRGITRHAQGPGSCARRCRGGRRRWWRRRRRCWRRWRGWSWWW
jgi:hypothetical protein